jgi:hypothetical protein
MKNKNIHWGDSWDDFEKAFITPQRKMDIDIEVASIVKKIKAKQQKLASKKVKPVVFTNNYERTNFPMSAGARD